MNHPSRLCPVCESQKKTLLYRQKFSRLSSQNQLAGYNVAVCEGCGATFADDIPGQEWFDAYYREVSKYTHDDRAGELPAPDRERFQAIADLIAPLLPEKESRILDFGCATGGLLRRLQEMGYCHLLGLDPSPASAEIARKRYGIRVINASLTEIARDETPFDLLIQVGVLEHIRDVAGALAAIRGVLRPGALTYVEVPDATGFAEWPGAPFQQFSVEHINFFSRSSLTGLMLRHSFEPVEVLRTARDHTSHSKMPVVCGFYRRTDATNIKPAFDEESGSALRSYIEESASAENRIAGIIDKLVVSQKPILVWGVGTHTLHLMETTAFSQVNIVAFVDSNTAYQGRELHGKPVLAPEALRAHGQPILIASQVFQAEIADQIHHGLRLPNEIITLY